MTVPIENGPIYRHEDNKYCEYCASKVRKMYHNITLFCNFCRLLMSVYAMVITPIIQNNNRKTICYIIDYLTE